MLLDKILNYLLLYVLFTNLCMFNFLFIAHGVSPYRYVFIFQKKAFHRGKIFLGKFMGRVVLQESFINAFSNN